MTPYDYNQQPYSTLPAQQSMDPPGQYETQLSHYGPIITYSPNTDMHLLPHVPSALSMQPVSYLVNINGGKLGIKVCEAIFRCLSLRKKM
jgi:hypothetical protein